MKKLNKIIAVLLSISMTTTFVVGCGKKDKQEEQNGKSEKNKDKNKQKNELNALNMIQSENIRDNICLNRYQLC